VLSQDEVERAGRFHFPRHRNHFIVARGLLRTILASYLDVKPSELRFSYAAKGKPSLENFLNRSNLKFNLAHSHERAIYGFTRNREVGIDIEFEREDLADEDVAKRFFSKAEVAALQTLSPEERKTAFFRCWTRKEAYIKARGEGLSMPLNQFDVSLTPGEPAALLRNRTDVNEISRWSMQSLSVDPGYVAALVVEGHNWRIKTFRTPTWF
jgi:4'-phosphopantetheinyl transferase